MRFINFFIVLGLTATILSCKKDPEETPTTVDAYSNGLLVLNEGLFQQNNSSLSWVQFGSESVNNEVFEQKTNRQLGDTGNDIQRYGNKIYIVVTVSSTLEIMNATSGAPIHQVQLTDNGTPKQPRSIAFHGGKAFITCYDGYVDVMDTANFSILQRIPVGANPEQIVVANNKLYVSNSGGLNYPNVDSTVSVIDPLGLVELSKITVGKNPGSLTVDHQGNVFVVARGNYGSIPSRLVKINTVLDGAYAPYPFNASGVTRMNNKLLIHSIHPTTSVSTIQLFDPVSGSIENSNYMNIGSISTLYGMQYDASRDRIYCFDAMNYTNSGYVRIYTGSGTYLQSFNVGLNPSKALIYE